MATILVYLDEAAEEAERRLRRKKALRVGLVYLGALAVAIGLSRMPAKSGQKRVDTQATSTGTSATDTSATDTSATNTSATETSATETSATETSATDTTATGTVNGGAPSPNDRPARWPQPTLSVTPAAIDFGEQPVGGRSAAQLVAIRNDDSGPVDAAISLTADDFAVVSGCEGSLAPGGDCLVAIVFAPTAAGGRADFLTVTTGTSQRSIALTGLGSEYPPWVDGMPHLCLTPQTLHFEKAGLEVLTLSNTGDGPAPVEAILTRGSNGAGYDIAADVCTRTLQPGDACRFTVLAHQPAIDSRQTLTIEVHQAAGPPLTACITAAPHTRKDMAR